MKQKQFDRKGTYWVSSEKLKKAEAILAAQGKSVSDYLRECIDKVCEEGREA